MTILYILAGVLGAICGGVIGWLIKALKDKIKLLEMEKDLNDKIKEKNEVVKILAETKQDLADTDQLLADSLTAIELLKTYDVIDKAAAKKIQEIKEVQDNGTSTAESKAAYKSFIGNL